MKIYLLLICLFCISLAGYSQTTEDKKPDEKPGYWQVPGKSSYFKIGGYIKMDLIYDFDPIGSPYYFDVSTIPTDGSVGTSTQFNVKETRLSLENLTNSKVGLIKSYVEGDFYGTNGTFRLRHAYVEINGKWFAGQYWSNFMDETIIPKTLDFEKPTAYAFSRNVMFKRIFRFSETTHLDIALEEPKNTGQIPTEPGEYESPFPDLTARFRIEKEWGHIQLSGFGGATRYRYDTNAVTDIALYGANLSGKLNIGKGDYVIYQAVGGYGTGRYRGGLSASLDSNGKLVALPDLGFTFGYHHKWSDKFSSLAVYNHGIIDNTGGQAGNAIHDVYYYAVNFLYHFDPNGFVGLEYIGGSRIDKDAESGSAKRLQFSVKYAFN